MKHAIRLGIAAVVVLFSSLCLLEVLYSESQFPLNTGTVLSADYSQSSASKEETLAALRQMGDTTGIRIYKLVPDQEDFFRGTTVVALGSRQPAQPVKLTWLDPSRHGWLVGSDHLGVASLQGQYAISGSETAVGVLSDWMRREQVQFTLTNVDRLDLVVATLTTSGAWVSMVAALVLLATVAMGWCASRAQSRAYRLLNGRKPLGILVEDIAGLLRIATRATCVVVGLVAVALWATRGGAHASAYALGVVPYLAIGALLLTIWVTLLSIVTWPHVDGLSRREPPLRRFERTSSMIKVAVLGIAVASLPGLVSATMASATAAEAMARWSPLGNHVAVRVGNVSIAQYDSALHRITDFLAESTTEDVVTLCMAILPNDVHPYDVGPFDGVVLTDRAYLDAMMLSDGGATLVELRRDDLPPGVNAYLDAQLPVWSADPHEEATLEILEYRGSAPFPGIGTDSGNLLLLKNPLVLVSRNPADFFNQDFLASAFSSQNLMFDDVSKLRLLLDRHSLEDLVVSIDRVSDVGLISSQSSRQAALMRALSMGLICLALGITIAISADIYAAAHSKQHFPLRAAGSSWPSILAARLASETLLVTLLAGAVATALFVRQVEGTGLWLLVIPPVYVATTWNVHIIKAQDVFQRFSSRRSI